ncbi:MAG: adenylate/guanylate cyclase domain-containing protein, partial [Candidatus Tectomicrobia bacterium]
GEIEPEVLRDKIVLLGTSAASVKDFFYTPYSRGLHADQQMSGIALHAHLISQLLRFGLDGNTPIGTASAGQQALWLLWWSVMGSMMGLWVRSPWRFALCLASGLLVLGLVVYAAFVGGWVIPLVPPAMAWVIAAAVVVAYVSHEEKAQRALLMHLFSRHVSPEVAEIIWRQRNQFLHGGRPRSQEVMVTVLLSDLEGFTSVSEKLAPQVLMDWLNIYMETMAQLVIEHGGVVDDYAGDGLKANFGVPLARTTEAEVRRDAVNAVQCALAMATEMRRLNQHYEEQSLPTVKMRIGICTGSVVVGSLGSAQRLKYTTVGDTVNTAARLESAAKDLVHTLSPCRILIGETTFQYLNGQFQTQRVGEVSFAGKEEKITAYCVPAREDDTFGSTLEEERQ